MKANKETSHSFFYTLLDRYIYHVVVNKKHKRKVSKNSQEIISITETNFQYT